MRLLLFSSSLQGPGESLRRLLKESFPAYPLDVYRSISGLFERLCQPKSDLAVVILVAGSMHELDALVSISNLLENVRIVLLLPDRESETVLKGHQLRPRFLAYADGDLLDITAVLNKMLAMDCPGTKTVSKDMVVRP